MSEKERNIQAWETYLLELEQYTKDVRVYVKGLSKTFSLSSTELDESGENPDKPRPPKPPELAG